MNQQAVTTTVEVEDTGPDAEVLAEWLVAVGQRQDRECFARLFEHYAPRIKTYMLRLGADYQSAEDLAQETLVKIWNKAGTYDRQRAVPSAWIFRIARNLRIDRLRRQKYHEVEFNPDDTAVIESQPTQTINTGHMDAVELASHVQSLPGNQLEVVRLAFFEGLSHSEICQRLDLPLGTVKSRLRLAFGKLRKTMGTEA